MAYSELQIEAIQNSGYQAALVVAGGGMSAIQTLLLHPGASRFVLEVAIPYSTPAMFDYLGEKLDTFCSEEAAKTMAQRAFERAMILSLSQKSELPILGIACTAALQTNRPRRGEDSAYLYIKSRDREVSRAVMLPPESRAAQDERVSIEFIQIISEFTARS